MKTLLLNTTRLLVLLMFQPLIAFATPAKMVPHLYKVTKNGISSYLFGTIHIGVNLEELPPIVLTSLSKAKYVYSEISLEYAKKYPATLKMFKDNYRKDQDLPCKELELHNERALLAQALIKAGMQRALACSQYQEKLPSLSTVMYSKYFNSDHPKLFLDQQLALYLADHGAEIIEIESEEILEWTAQLQNQVSTPSEPVTTYTPSDIQYSVKVMNELIERYLSGTQERVYDFDGEDYAVKLRNSHWLDKLLPAMKETIAVKVGVSHLYGDYGLLALLSAYGFTVERYAHENPDF